MTVQMFKLVGVGVLGASLLAGCGGGGGGDGAPAAPSTPTTSNFAASKGYTDRIKSGSNDNFNLSGSCGGTATIKTEQPIAATFEGVDGFSAAQVSTVSFSNCSTVAPMVTGKTFYTAAYAPIGLAIDGGEYARYEAPLPTGLPASVKVGATGTIVTYLSYNDRTQAVPNGKRIVTYKIEDDTSTTAMLNVVTTAVDLAGATQSVQQSRYRMAENGALTLVSITVDFNDTAKTKLVFTPR